MLSSNVKYIGLDVHKENSWGSASAGSSRPATLVMIDGDSPIVVSREVGFQHYYSFQ